MSEAQTPTPLTIQQVCVIPYRRTEDKVEFCLITSLKKRRWIFPKGIVDPGDTYEQSALKEAHEEAGLHGQLVGGPLGQFFDAKWGARLIVKVVLMEVNQADATWPETDVRQRQWLDYDAAQGLLARRELKSFLHRAKKSLTQDAGTAQE
jgi:8-oxo-dGTP pyrophosphatase MutT (NUDIX family)